MHYAWKAVQKVVQIVQIVPDGNLAQHRLRGPFLAEARWELQGKKIQLLATMETFGNSNIAQPPLTYFSMNIFAIPPHKNLPLKYTLSCVMTNLQIIVTYSNVY